MTNLQEEFNEEIENQQINEEYKIWKKNAPFLYDMVITHVLDWPSLTCQWLPVKDRYPICSLYVIPNSPPDSDYSIHKLILGTHTSDQESNYLMIAKVRLPNEDNLVDITEYNVANKEVGGMGLAGGDNRIDIETKILHDGEVNRARFMPQKYNVIATHTISGEVHVFDYSQHPTVPTSLEVRPEIKLIGHQAEGYGMSWSKHKAGHLLTGANDSKILLWNIEGSNLASKTLKPFSEFKFHNGSVEDVAWHTFNPEIFASVGDDRKVALWDLRKPQTPSHDILGHAAEINTIDFNPFDEYLFLTGSSDKTIGFWDLRNTSKSLHIFEGHIDDVIKVEWEPSNSSVFASSSADRRIRIWDISKIGQEQKAEDAADGPPELLFIHGGHRAKIPDFSWNTNENLLMASVEEENNILQIWQLVEKHQICIKKMNLTMKGRARLQWRNERPSCVVLFAFYFGQIISVQRVNTESHPNLQNLLEMSYFCIKCDEKILVEIPQDDPNNPGELIIVQRVDDPVVKEFLQTRTVLVQALKELGQKETGMNFENYNPETHSICEGCLNALNTKFEKENKIEEDAKIKTENEVEHLSKDIINTEKRIKDCILDDSVEKNLLEKYNALEVEEEEQKRELDELGKLQIETEQDEQRYWDEMLNFEKKLYLLNEKKHTASSQLKEIQSEIDRLSRINVLNDIIQISAEHEVAKVNNLMLGKTFDAAIVLAMKSTDLIDKLD